jgi:hypothetical protein
MMEKDLHTRSDEKEVHEAEPSLRPISREGELQPGFPGEHDRARVYVRSGLVISFFPAVWVIWSFLTRGGVTLRIMGLTLVRGSGSLATRLQCAWRTLLVWLPPTLLLIASFWIYLFHPAGGELALGLWWLANLALLGYFGLALRYPSRGLHDWLAGTYLVPR